MIKIVYFETSTPDFQKLNTMLDDEYYERFGKIALKYRSYNTLEDIHDFFVAYDGDDSIACGCIKKYSADAAELKRVFVLKDYRRKDIAYEIVKKCEEKAIEKGYKSMILETGSEMPEAIALYKKLEYRFIENYDQFTGDNIVVCMRKELYDFIIRPMQKQELPLMEEFQYLAIFQRNEKNLIPREVIYDPTIIIYFENWGTKDDFCLVAEKDKQVVGMVWTRLLNGKVRGFGNIDDSTPEFAISLLKEYRNQGIGTVLMKAMLELLKGNGYAKASLAVQKDNYALSMYQKVGFEIVDENEEEYIMICPLTELR